VGLLNVEVLEITNWTTVPGVRMREEVHQSDQAALPHRNVAADPVLRISDSVPQDVGIIGRGLRLVEREIGVPQVIPTRSVRFRRRLYDDVHPRRLPKTCPDSEPPILPDMGG
jgi:hypothetical protein